MKALIPKVNIKQQSQIDRPVTSDNTIMDDTVALMDDPTALMGGLSITIEGNRQTIDNKQPKGIIKIRR